MKIVEGPILHQTCIYVDSPPSIALQTNTDLADTLELLHTEPGISDGLFEGRDMKRPKNKRFYTNKSTIRSRLHSAGLSHQPSALNFHSQMSWRHRTKQAELIAAPRPHYVPLRLDSVWLPNELTKNPIHHP